MRICGVRLSVLDQTPVPEGVSPAQALRNSVDLASFVDELGYHRYWVAEHHGMHGLAGSSPEILIGHIAENTNHIRVGSGGVMLSHYSPLKVAENFQVLQALHPNRIDMGLGRAPGSDARTAYALQSSGNASGSGRYLESVIEIRTLLRRESIETGPLAGVEALPLTETMPELWLLASSEGSSFILISPPLERSLAHFINGNGTETCNLYRKHFRPSFEHSDPVVSVGVNVLCAESEEEVASMLESLELWRKDGLRGPIPKAGNKEGENSLTMLSPSRPMVIGTPELVHEQLLSVANAYQAEELLIVTICHDHEQRKNSYRLIAEQF